MAFARTSIIFKLIIFWGKGKRFMKHLVKLLLLLSAVFLLAANSYAIPDTYGTAEHKTQKWQELATDGQAGTNGVFWSVDGGTTWGQDDLVVGQFVSFKFNMHKRNAGTHYADFLKTWLDWEQDGSFDTDDVIIFEEKQLRLSQGAALVTGYETEFSYFTTDSFEILDSYVGDLWLRSRVVCSESLVSSVSFTETEKENRWKNQWDDTFLASKGGYDNIFQATGEYYQGEVEEYKLTVTAAPVPEPATLFLLGFGMIGLAGIRRHQSKK